MRLGGLVEAIKQPKSRLSTHSSTALQTMLYFITKPKTNTLFFFTEYGQSKWNCPDSTWLTVCLSIGLSVSVLVTTEREGLALINFAKNVPRKPHQQCWHSLLWSYLQILPYISTCTIRHLQRVYRWSLNSSILSIQQKYPFWAPQKLKCNLSLFWLKRLAFRLCLSVCS